MRKITYTALALLTAATLFTSCSTEVELNTEWKNTTIIYGLLNRNENIHYVLINKAFLGEGDSYQMAMIPDSSEYDNVDAYIEEIANGVVIDTFRLNETTLTNRPTDGIFYAPNQKAYYFVKPGLDEDHQYRIRVRVAESADEISATTEVVRDFAVDNPNSVNTFAFATSNVASPQYYTKSVKWIPSNAVRYEVIVRIKWDEITASGTTRKTLDWHQGTKFSEDATGGKLEVSLEGQQFFQFLDNNIPNDANVIARKFRAIDFIIYGAAQDVDTYIKVNEPSSGLVQERPEFTNVVNGIGLFSSRNHVVYPNRKISQGTMAQLAGGMYTSDLLFCSDSAIYSSESYYCP